MIDVLAMADLKARTVLGDIEEGHSCCFLRGFIGLLLAGNPRILSESYMTLVHEAQKCFCTNNNRSVLGAISSLSEPGDPIFFNAPFPFSFYSISTEDNLTVFSFDESTQSSREICTQAADTHRCFSP